MFASLCARLAITVFAAALIIPLMPAAAEQTTVGGPTSPVGTWNAEVFVPDVGPHDAVFSFTANGKACVAGEGLEGTGTWWRTGPRRFSYRIAEKVYDENGVHWMSIDVNQDALQNRKTYTSSGISYFFEPDGTPNGSTEATVTATRASTNNPRCP